MAQKRQASFNDDGNYTPAIKDSAIHVRKVPTPSSADLEQTNTGNATVRPGSNTDTTYAPKSNRTSAGYKNGTSMGGK